MAELSATSKSRPLLRRSKKYLEEVLYKTLFKSGSSEESVRRELNNFLKGPKKAQKWEVGVSIRKLRQRKRFSTALKLSETMAKRGMNLTLSDNAIRLDLVAKARGISSAEKYFMELPEPAKNHLSYGALLNSYCKELMTEKAEALMEKMKELRFATSSMSYNSLMTLYSKTGHPEKIPAVIQEMKAADVMPDCFTYNIWMRGLAAINDIAGVECVLDEMKRDGRVTGDWTTYSNLASIYVDAGMFEKAEAALKELEKRNARRDLEAFHFLITLYGRTKNLTEVYRVWRSLKLAFPKVANVSYLNMVHVLVSLDDLPGAEKCFREWESKCSRYDIRVANVLIGAYAKAGMLEKAEAIKLGAGRQGAKPNVKTWEIFMDYYLKKGEVEPAVKCIANAILTGRGDGGKWVPSPEVVHTVMGHFEQEKDVDSAEAFLQILNKAECNLGAEVFESLIRTYSSASRTSPAMRRRLKMENVVVSQETSKLLDAVCVE